MDAQASIVDLKIRQLFRLPPLAQLVATIAALLAAIVGLWAVDLGLPTIKRKRHIQSWLPKSTCSGKGPRTCADVQSCFRLSEAALAC